MHILTLSDELFIEWARLLDPESMLSAALTCKHWRRLVRRNGLLQRAITPAFSLLQRRRRSERAPLRFAPYPPVCGLNHRQRRILVEWLIDVAGSFELSDDALHLGVRLTDASILAGAAATKDTFQLLGCTCLLLAVKLLDATRPEVPEMSRYVWVTDDAYTVAEMVAMERKVLRVLNHALHMPTMAWFLEPMLQAYAAGPPVKSLARYFATLVLPHMDALIEQPAALAAAAVALACSYLGQPQPTPDALAGYAVSELGAPCAMMCTAAAQVNARSAAYLRFAQPMAPALTSERCDSTIARLVAARQPQIPPAGWTLCAEEQQKADASLAAADPSSTSRRSSK